MTLKQKNSLKTREIPGLTFLSWAPAILHHHASRQTCLRPTPTHWLQGYDVPVDGLWVAYESP